VHMGEQELAVAKEQHEQEENKVEETQQLA
jgi:hypothetical protein